MKTPRWKFGWINWLLLCCGGTLHARPADPELAERLCGEQVLSLSVAVEPRLLAAAASLPTDYLQAQLTLDGEPPGHCQVKLLGADARMQSRPVLELRSSDSDATSAGRWALRFDPGSGDPSYLRAWAANQIARRLAVPVLGVGHVRLTLNGRKLGLYVVSQRMTTGWLERHHGTGTGTVLEGAGTDITGPLTVIQPGVQPDQRLLEELRRACLDPEPNRRAQELAKHLPLDAFCRFMALEGLVRPMTGYCEGTQHYLLHLDAAANRVRFIPAGLDRGFVGIKVPVLTAKRGLVAAAVMQSGEGRWQYVRALLELVGEGRFEPELIGQLRLRQALLHPSLDGPAQSQRFDRACQQLEGAIGRRFAEVRKQLAGAGELSAGDLARLKLPGISILERSGQARLPVRSPIGYRELFEEKLKQLPDPAATAPPETALVEIEAPEGVLEGLSWRSTNWVLVSVRHNGRPFNQVGLRLKGHGSRQSFQTKPSFTLKFNQLIPGQKLDGQSKLHIHNARFDPSLLHEYTGAWLFQRAGLPAPRVGYAQVVVNGRDYGLFVTVEAVTKFFLENQFGARDALLLEGESSDINGALDLDSGVLPPGPNPVLGLHLAAQEAIGRHSIEPLRSHCDVEQLARFVALEVVLGHRDGYSLGANNYRLCQPAPEKPFVLLPHGMDVLALDSAEGIFPSMKGILAVALTGTEDGRVLYLNRLERILQQALDMERYVSDLAAVCSQLQHRLQTTAPWQRNTQLTAAASLAGALGDRRAFLLSQVQALASAGAANKTSTP